MCFDDFLFFKKIQQASMPYFHVLLITSFLYTLYLVYSWFLFHENIYALLLFESRFSCAFHISWIHLYFILYLKDFALVFKIIIKLVSLFFNLIEFSNMIKVFSNHIFENSCQPKGGWMSDHALYTRIEYLSDMCIIWW